MSYPTQVFKLYKHKNKINLSSEYIIFACNFTTIYKNACVL